MTFKRGWMYASVLTSLVAYRLWQADKAGRGYTLYVEIFSKSWQRKYDHGGRWTEYGDKY